ncbi:FIST signal transduction protein [Glacieibacterium sp.]|uniref:FIST signal transduction protein n=1 Tax=Glacieibacterium sp. TaxID=2860237 RepID=UPI003B0069BB
MPAPPAGNRSPPAIRAAATHQLDPAAAVAELRAGLGDAPLAGILLFVSSRHDLRRLSTELALAFDELPIAGCTSSGELTPTGYDDGTITAIGFPADEFALTITAFPELGNFDPVAAAARMRRAVADAECAAEHLGTAVNHVGLFLVDGLCTREEIIAMTLQDALGDIPLIGGSSGDDLDFVETFVLDAGRFVRDTALVAIISTTRPMTVFRNQHFAPTTTRMVVTSADPLRRIVYEINAEPAAQEYARLIGAGAEPLSPRLFASHPLLVRAGTEHYVRAIQQANADDSLTFYCAIDEGIVLTLTASPRSGTIMKCPGSRVRT